MNKTEWEISVPMFRNRFILKGLCMALGIPFGVLIAVIVILAKGDIMGTDAKYALFMIGALFLLTYILILIVYAGNYATGFAIDDTGIKNYTQSKQAKKNKVLNTILIFLGLFSGNYSAAGAGVLAQSRQLLHIKWKNVTKVKYYPKQNTILVKGGFAEKIAIFCTKENYSYVESVIKEKIKIPLK